MEAALNNVRSPNSKNGDIITPSNVAYTNKNELQYRNRQHSSLNWNKSLGTLTTVPLRGADQFCRESDSCNQSRKRRGGNLGESSKNVSVLDEPWIKKRKNLVSNTCIEEAKNVGYEKVCNGLC